MYCTACKSTNFRDLFTLAASISHCLCPASIHILCQSHKRQSSFLASPAYLLTVFFCGISAEVCSRMHLIYSLLKLVFLFFFADTFLSLLQVNFSSTSPCPIVPIFFWFGRWNLGLPSTASLAFLCHWRFVSPLALARPPPNLQCCFAPDWLN